MGGKGALNYLPIVPKAFVYVPKVMHKPVMGGNTVSKDFRAHVSPPKCVKFPGTGPQTVNLVHNG